MKRILFAAVALVMTASSAFAQAKLNFIEPRVSVGLTLPGSVKSGPVSIDAFRPGVTTNVDMAFNVGIGSSFYIEPAVGFFASRVNGNDNLLGKLGTAIGLDTDYVELGIDVPVMLGFKVMSLGGTSLNLFTGPKCDFGLYCHGNAKASVGGASVEDSVNLYDKNFSPFNIQWGLGAGYAVGSVQFRLAGYVGLNNRYNGEYDDVTYRQGAVMLSVGYQF